MLGFVALADVAHGFGPDLLCRRGEASISSIAILGTEKVHNDDDSDQSVATSLFVEVNSHD
jgi:isochorismate synthase EntC